MIAQVINTFGSEDVFQSSEVSKPFIKPGYVIIKVKASSVNPVDIKIRSGAYGHISPNFPAILHGDVSGIINEIGEGVTNFKVGDEVYGCAGGVKGEQGALSDYMLADACLIAKKPSSISMIEAATLPLVSITAWEGLVTKVNIKPGQKVLIHGGVGGVGRVATQLAAALGAEVYTTVSSAKKANLVLGVPQSNIINYKKEAVEDYVRRLTNGVGFDIVFDTVGGKNLETSMKALAQSGSLVTSQGNCTVNLATLHSKSANLHCILMLIPLLTNQKREEHGKILEEIAKLVEHGKMKPLLYPKYFKFSEISQAHHLLESGAAYGKVVLINE